jgi:hypothetical protein
MDGPPAANQVTVTFGADGALVTDDPDVEERECRVCAGVFGFRWDRWEPDVCDSCLAVINP